MVKVGDRIRLSSGKGPYRDGVVAAVTGSMVRVRWSSEEETTVIPAPGTLTVLAPSGDQASPAVRGERAATKEAAPKKTATAKKAGTKKSTTSKTTATAKKDGTMKTTGTRKGATMKTTGARKGATKKTTGAKRSSR